MTTTDLKPGDRVRTLPANYIGTDIAAGETGEIVSIDGASVARIRFDDDTYWKIHTDRLEEEALMNDPETVRTCADKTLTLIEMSEFSEVLDDLQNLDQLAERIDWNYFLAEACDHVPHPDDLGDPNVIEHLNAVNVAADLMIQDHPQAETPAPPESEMDEATRAVHAQLEDLTPPEALEVLARVRRELIVQTIDVALFDHFAGAIGPIDGLLEQLEEFGLQITAKEIS